MEVLESLFYLLSTSNVSRQKQGLQIAENAQTPVGHLVEERGTIFIGPGTTLEFFARELPIDNIRVVTIFSCLLS